MLGLGLKLGLEVRVRGLCERLGLALKLGLEVRVRVRVRGEGYG